MILKLKSAWDTHGEGFYIEIINEVGEQAFYFSSYADDPHNKMKEIYVKSFAMDLTNQ